MWWSCGTAPEYLVSYFEMHLHDQYGAMAEMARVGSHCLVFLFGLWLFVIYGFNSNVLINYIILLFDYNIKCLK